MSSEQATDPMPRLRANALRYLAPYNIPADVLDAAIEVIIGTWIVLDAERRGVIQSAGEAHFAGAP